MQTTASTSRPEASADEEKNDENTDAPTAGWSECNVCFDVAKDPVVGNCGHLFWLVSIIVLYYLLIEFFYKLYTSLVGHASIK